MVDSLMSSYCMFAFLCQLTIKILICKIFCIKGNIIWTRCALNFQSLQTLFIFRLRPSLQKLLMNFFTPNMAVTTNFHHFKHPLERMFPDQCSSIMKANVILKFNVFSHFSTHYLVPISVYEEKSVSHNNLSDNINFIYVCMPINRSLPRRRGKTKIQYISISTL
jgi:hypothetical protein